MRGRRAYGPVHGTPRRRALPCGRARACARGSARAARRDALARPGGWRGVERGGRPGVAASRGHVLGEPVRLASPRGSAECVAAVSGPRRRHPGSLRPHERARLEADAAHHHPRMAGLGVRDAADRSDARGPVGAWGVGAGRVRRGGSIDSRVRLLGAADRARDVELGGRRPLDRADGTARVSAVRGAGRRLGRGDLDLDRAEGARAAPRAAPQLHPGLVPAVGGEPRRR